MELNFTALLSAFLVLFAIIDISGLVPIVIGLKSQGREISPGKAAIYSLAIMLAFYFIGDWILSLFGVDVQSFAVAGSLVIFVVALEMTFGLEIFKNDNPGGSATLVPLVFPLIAGPGVFTAILSLRAEFNTLTILVALIINISIVYIVLKKLHLIERFLGAGGVYILRKFFGIILLAVSVKLFTSNITALIESF